MPDAVHYESWNWKEVLMWILNLDGGRFKKYEEALRATLEEEDVTGDDLREAVESDVRGWGVKNLRDRKLLIQCIEKLMKKAGDAPDELSIENKSKAEGDVNPEWTKSDTSHHPYDCERVSTEIKVAVGAIADVVGSSVAAMSSGGTLTPVLLNSLKNCVVNVKWSQESSGERIIKHLHDGDAYVFVEIVKTVQISKKGAMGMSREWTKIKGDVKWMYLEAGNEAARRQLSDMKRKRAEEAFKYIDGLKGWNSNE